MVSLDQPALTLGALFLVGQDERGRQFTGGESGKGLLAGGFAASSSNYAIDQIRQMAGVQSSAISDELAQALLGAGLSRFGDPIPQSNAMARGILYNVADDAFTKAGMTLGDFAGGMTGGGGTQSASGVSASGGATGMTHTGSQDNGVRTY